LSCVVLVSTAEFALKSQPVRQQLVRLLKRHIRFKLKRLGQDSCRITSAGGFIVVNVVGDAKSVAGSLAGILGVSHADACERVAPVLDEIVECSARLAVREIKQGQTFAVRARSFEPSPLKGKEIEIRAGSEILSRLSGDVKVDLSSPDRTVRVFYGVKDAYISATRRNGPSGLPVGSQGSLLGLATDAVYSPLAFYMLMKRGALVWPFMGGLQPPLGGVPPEEILQGLKRLRPYVPKNRYSARLVRLDDSTKQTILSVRPDVQRLFCMRLMFRTVKHLSPSAVGLVTADRFGTDGVASLKDLRALGDVTTFPVYRPLLALEEAYAKQQLEELGLTQLATEKVAPQALSSAHTDVVDEVRALEDRLQAEQLAQKIAAYSSKIQIDFP